MPGAPEKDDVARLAGYDDWERRAREVLDDGAFNFVFGGAGADETVRANRESFYRWRLVPRVLKDVAARELRTSLLGHDLPAPLLLAPVGNRDAFAQEGELATARAGASLRIPFILSTFTTVTFADVAAAMGDAPRWFQLYPSTDPEVMASFIRRAEASGFSAIVITVDEAGTYPRYSVMRTGYSPLGMGTALYFSDPVFRSRLAKPPEEDRDAAMGIWRRIIHTPSLTWDDVGRIRRQTKLPVLLKGLLHPSDAELAVSQGVDGIIVSNHGGRRLDGEVAAIDVLPKVCDAVQGRTPVLMDSGVRGGADVVKALALGAVAVLVGRAHVYGLAVAGRSGVESVITGIMHEIDQTLAICGCRTPGELDRSLLIRD